MDALGGYHFLVFLTMIYLIWGIFGCGCPWG